MDERTREREREENVILKCTYQEEQDTKKKH